MAIEEGARQQRKSGDGQYFGILGILTNLRRPSEPAWPAGFSVNVQLSEGPRAQVITMPIEPFISLEDQRASFSTPLCFSELEVVRCEQARAAEDGGKEADDTAVDVTINHPPPAELDANQARTWRLKQGRAKARAEERARGRERARAQRQAQVRVWNDSLRRIWLFRDGIYVAEAPPRPSELEELVLQIKSMHYQRDDALRRRRDQVANFEAAESYLARGIVRRPLADDVKLLVWTRDGGACVRCGAQTGLHFDHIIPLAKGGSDSADNIQILCQACNLAKSDRIA